MPIRSCPIVLIFAAAGSLFLSTARAEIPASTKTAIIKNSDGNIVGFSCQGQGDFLAVYDKHGRGKGFIGAGQRGKVIISEPGDRYYLMPGNLPLNREASQAMNLTFRPGDYPSE